MHYVIINNRQTSSIQNQMFYMNTYYPFQQIPDYCMYYYPMPAQSLPFIPGSNCLPLPESPFFAKPTLVEESSQATPIKLEKSKTIQKKMKGGKQSESISEEKISKNILTASQKIESSGVENNICRQVKLQFRIEWKNENRNIVPNLINQMISYLLKKIKSQKLVRRIFNHIPHDPNWTEKKFYLYMKKIKESITHYVNQNVILRFLEIHEPKCELYEYEEQLFYMRVSRIAIKKFLQDDAVLISLTSNRMSQAKRKIHLIARDALLHKFTALCQQLRH